MPIVARDAPVPPRAPVSRPARVHPVPSRTPYLLPLAGPTPRRRREPRYARARDTRSEISGIQYSVATSVRAPAVDERLEQTVFFSGERHRHTRETRNTTGGAGSSRRLLFPCCKLPYVSIELQSLSLTFGVGWSFVRDALSHCNEDAVAIRSRTRHTGTRLHTGTHPGHTRTRHYSTVPTFPGHGHWSTIPHFTQK
jgi:hypothetical protein